MIRPGASRRFDYGGKRFVVIGRAGRHILHAEAWGCIVGCSMGVEVTNVGTRVNTVEDDVG